jgi:hypothetical protein
MLFLIPIFLELAFCDTEDDQEAERREQNRVERDALLQRQHKIRDKLIGLMRNRRADTSREEVDEEDRLRGELDKTMAEEARLRDDLVAGIQPMIDRKMRKVREKLGEDPAESERRKEDL